MPVALPSATASTWSQVSPASHTVGCASLSYMLNFPEIGSILIEKRKKSAMPIGIHEAPGMGARCGSPEGEGPGHGGPWTPARELGLPRKSTR